MTVERITERKRKPSKQEVLDNSAQEALDHAAFRLLQREITREEFLKISNEHGTFDIYGAAIDKLALDRKEKIELVRQKVKSITSSVFKKSR
jgi:hypothetical protein